MTTQPRSPWPLIIVLGLSAAFFAIFMMVSVILYFKSGTGDTYSEGSKSAKMFKSGEAVAVLEVKGVIMDSKKATQRIRALAENEEAKALVVRIDSPGGAVAPSQEIYEALKEFPKPVVVSMGSLAASGGYYIAMGAKKIFANQGTLTGSIGVIMEFANLRELMKWAKVEQFSIKTGPFKDSGAMNREMRPDERAYLQGIVDNTLIQFKDAVAKGRGLSPEKVTEVADGRIFTGVQAKALGLVDELGTLQDAIIEAGKLAGIKGKPRVIYPKKPTPKFMDLLLDQKSGSDDEAESSAQSSSWLARIALRALGINESAEASSPSLFGLSPGVYALWRGIGE